MWINPNCISSYTSDGQKEGSSNILEGEGDPTNCNFSIKKLMQLQTGKGIEYLLTLLKLNYHGVVNGIKKNKRFLKSYQILVLF